MALRVVFAWIGLNIGALLLFALVDVLRLTAKRVVRIFSRPQVLEQQP
jgi:hypothetical protein